MGTTDGSVAAIAVSKDLLRYGRIVSTSSGEDNSSMGVRKVQVQVSTEKSTMKLSTQIYSFRSARDGGISSGGASPPPSTRGSGTPTFLWKRQQQLDSAEQGLPPPPPPSSTLTAAPATPIFDPAQTDKAVSDSDVIGAISGLLVRAGIPMTLQEKDLMERVLELQASNKRIETALQQERQQHLETRNHLAGAVNVFHCGVCLTNDIDNVITPCGHPICETCLNHLHRRQCPFCRNNILNTVKLFLPHSENDEDL